MAQTIQYRASRKEIWAWYRVAWRRRLWKVHVGVFMAVFLYEFAVLGGFAAPSAKAWLLAGAIALVAPGLMALTPLLLFKPQMRQLTIDPGGLTTQIGAKSGHVPWAAVESIADTGEFIVITGTDGNAFIVPQRAFSSALERTAFVQYLRTRARQ